MTNSDLTEWCSSPLETKKKILDHIEAVRKIPVTELEEQEWQELYNFIYLSIEKLKEKVKPNTVHFLKTQLKSALAKRVLELDPVEEDPFVIFLKEAYPEKDRDKRFLLALADPTKMPDEHILVTLKYISNEMQTGYKIDSKERASIRTKIEQLRSRRNLKALKQIKSLEGLRRDSSLEKYIRKLVVS